MVTPPDQIGGRSSVQIAFALGWHIAEFHSDSHATGTQESETDSADDLPGLSHLSHAEHQHLSLEQLRVDLYLLGPPCAAAAITLPPTDALASKLEAGSWEDAKAEIVSLHQVLLINLTAADFTLGKAYGLGRALADTAMLPVPANPDTYEKAFNTYRVRNLTDWLSDLESAFPALSAPAVTRSLQLWVDWVADPKINGQQVALKDGGGHLTRALHEQGRLWRSLLSGEKRPSELLAVSDYIAAAERLATQTSRLALNYLIKWKWAATITVLAVALTFGLIFGLLSGSSKTAAAVVAIIGWLGISWKGVGGTLGRSLSRLESPLWQLEIAEAIAQASNRLPQQFGPELAQVQNPPDQNHQLAQQGSGSAKH